MSAFLLIVIACTAAALLCVLPALLRRADDGAAPAHDGLNLALLRDQARELDADLARGTLAPAAREEAREELAQRLAQRLSHDLGPARAAQGQRPQTWTALLLAVAIPAAAGAVYLQVGNPAALSLGGAARVQDGAHEVGAREIVGMVQGLAERLRREPNDLEGWHMLARSYTALGRYQDAAEAYARLARLAPQDAGVLADYADALGTANGASLQGEPAALIERALALDPTQVKALALSGSAAFEAGDYQKALRQWEAALAQVPADSEFAASTRASIGEARARLGQGAPAPAAAPDRVAAAALVRGTVTLAPHLAARARPDDAVFVFARPVGGPAMPLAVLRARVRDLPLRFALGDGDSMAGARLSEHRAVEVLARVSRSGSATPSAGDFEGGAGTVTLPADGVEISIEKERK